MAEAERLAKEAERENQSPEAEAVSSISESTKDNVFQVESTAYTDHKENHHTYDG